MLDLDEEMVPVSKGSVALSRHIVLDLFVTRNGSVLVMSIFAVDLSSVVE